MRKKSFCSHIEENGERKTKYKRMVGRGTSDAAIEKLEEDGSREYQQAATYYAYSKDLCENYSFDLRKYRFCMNQKKYAAITKSDFVKFREDLHFQDNALNTVLTEYRLRSRPKMT